MIKQSTLTYKFVDERCILTPYDEQSPRETFAFTLISARIPTKIYYWQISGKVKIDECFCKGNYYNFGVELLDRLNAGLEMKGQYIINENNYNIIQNNAFRIQVYP
jgi:hypothetical protein